MPRLKNRSKPAYDDYSYLNARLRGMRSRLLGRDFFEQMLAASSMQEMTNMLANTAYMPEIEEYASAGAKLSDVEAALMHNLTRTFGNLLGLLKGEPLMLASMLLGRWDMLCIKAILRGKSIGASVSTIMGSIIPAGELEYASLEHLAQESPTVRAAIDTMVIWKLPYAKLLLGKKSIQQMELALDQYYFGQTIIKLKGRSSSVRVLRDNLSLEVDMINLMTLLRLKAVDIDDEARLQDARFLGKFNDDGNAAGAAKGSLSEKDLSELRNKFLALYYVDGGNGLDFKQFISLSYEASVAEIAKNFQGTSYGRHLTEAFKRYEMTGSISYIQRRAEKLVIDTGMKAYNKDPFSFATIMGYIWMKYNEMVNLRIVLRCKQNNVPEERIREELVFV